ncbi:SGNH/GDSL hydrolase family protein [Actinoplanes sp. NPDC049265]|uniref:SGNH/GDSL hydrolase family protein n=1 Tax=Actinoplanes sp. NPDC049265 TaxID=3363902 RepID=UPI00371CAD93
MRRRGPALMLATALLGACAPPPATAVPAAVVVTLGDSVPAGNACGCRPFPDLYARHLGARSVNLAAGGATTTDVARLLDTPTAQSAVRQASTVLIMVGANDAAQAFPGGAPAAYRTIAGDVQSQVTAMVRRLHDLDGGQVRVLVLGYWNVVEDGAVARTDYDAAETAEATEATTVLNEHLAAAARASWATYVSTRAALKGADGSADPTGLLAADGDHPNAQGHAAIAAALPG